MLPVSGEALKAIDAPAREFKGRITIQYTGNERDATVEVSATSSYDQNIAPLSQLVDGKNKPTRPWMAVGLKPNGSYYPAGGALNQVGWYGAAISTADGTFTTPEAVTLSFALRSISDITIVGESTIGSFPEDFKVEILQAGIWSTLVDVVGNQNLSYAFKSDEIITAVQGARLTVTKMNKPNVKLKLLEFDLSLQETYEDEGLVYMDLVEEVEPETEAIVIGAISSSQLSFALNNLEGKYFPSNAMSYLYGQLRNYRKVWAELGIVLPDESIEWIPYGPPMYTMGWLSDEIQAKTTARDILELMRRSVFSTSTVQTNKSAYDLYVYVLSEYGLDSTQYWIDPDLKDIRIPYAWWEEMSFLDALKRLSQATASRVWVSRDGTLKVAGYLYYFEERIAFATATETHASYTGANQLVDTKVKADQLWLVANSAPISNSPHAMATDGSSFVGWWSKSLSGADGAFAIPIELIVNFETHRIVNKWMVYGDDKLLQYPVHFKIEYQKTGSAAWLLYAEETANASPEYIQPSSDYADVSAIKLTIYSWSKPTARAKILEFNATNKDFSESATAALNDDNQIFSADQPLNFERVANYIEVLSTPRAVQASASVYSGGESFTLDPGVSDTVTLYYAEVPVINAAAPVLSNVNVTLVSWVAYAWGMEITVKNNTATQQVFTATINGQQIKALAPTRIVAKDDAAIKDMGLMKLNETLDNPFIQESATARTIADSLLKVYTDPAKDINVDVRGNPAIEVGDRVTVDHKPRRILNDGYVFRTELAYDGALSGKMTLRRA